LLIARTKIVAHTSLWTETRRTAYRARVARPNFSIPACSRNQIIRVFEVTTERCYSGDGATIWIRRILTSLECYAPQSSGRARGIDYFGLLFLPGGPRSRSRFQLRRSAESLLRLDPACSGAPACKCAFLPPTLPLIGKVVLCARISIR